MKNENLWAPWRMEYIKALCDDKSRACFLCEDLENPSHDSENFVLWRSRHCLVVLNKYPYNNGHLLIAPKRHIPDLAQCTDDELAELMKIIRDSQKLLSLAIEPHGFNVGMNFGRCSGAGLPGHLHIHVVPRWNGDTNFMAVCGDTDVISQSMTELYELLINLSAEHKLPAL